MAFAEMQIINALAAQMRSVAGVNNAYDFAQNPDSLSKGQLPAAIFWPPGFESRPAAHHNRWSNELTIRGSLFIEPIAARGGIVKFLENAAMPFGQLVRVKFQTKSTLSTLLATGTGNVTAWLESGQYGAGGQLLSHGGIEYIGWVFTWRWKEIN